MSREQVRRELTREIGAGAASAVTEVLGLRALAAKHAREHASVVQVLEAKEVELTFTVRCGHCEGSAALLSPPFLRSPAPLAFFSTAPQPPPPTWCSAGW